MEEKPFGEYGCYVDDCDGDGCVFDGYDGFVVTDCDIAIKVLQDEHGCTIDGAKVCFACAECDPVVADRP